MEESFVQKLTASALHEIWKTLVIDTSNIVIHQLAALECYNEEQDLESQIIVTDQDQEQLKFDSKIIVLKYHIFHQDGLGAKCTPFVNYIENGVQLNATQLHDPFIQNVLQGMQNFTSTNPIDLTKQIMNFDEHISQEQLEQRVINSYPEIDNQEIVIWEDGDVQCGCSYCDKFFEMNDIENFSFESLNFVQRVLAENYWDLINSPNVDEI